MEYSVYGDTKKIIQYQDINLSLGDRVSLIRFHCGLISIIAGSKYDGEGGGYNIPSVSAERISNTLWVVS